MAASERLSGWAGKVLKVNLTDGAVTEEPTIPKYQRYIGGVGIGFKVICDEVPPETESLLEIGKYNQ